MFVKLVSHVLSLSFDFHTLSIGMFLVVSLNIVDYQVYLVSSLDAL